MIPAVAGSVGIFVCTLTLSFKLMATSALPGVLGMDGYAYFMFVA